jgi:ribosome-associated translation inhibitor RaiA
MENVKISCGKGVESLDEYERGIIERLTIEYKAKLERHFENITSFDVHIKCFYKEGTVKRYAVGTRLIVPGHSFETSADEYDLHDSVHKALTKLMNEIEHKMHLSNQGRIKPRRKK